MKKAEDLKNEVLDNIKIMKQRKVLGQRYSSISKKNDQLKYFINYLELNPSEDYLVSERYKLQTIITAKSSQFEYWSLNVCPQDVMTTKRRALFNKEVGITDLKKRLKTLNYILN